MEQTEAASHLVQEVAAVKARLAEVTGSTDQTREKTQEIARKIQSANEQMHSLSGAMNDIRNNTGEITKIAKAIQDIAFQTNMKEVKARFGKYLDEVIYMPIVNLDKEDAKRQIDAFVEDMRPAAFELLFVKDSNPLPRMLADSLKGESLIWYNTLWDTMAGGHDDDMSLANPDEGYGYLIDVLGCRIIQTDRPAYLLDYLRKRGICNAYKAIAQRSGLLPGENVVIFGTGPLGLFSVQIAKIMGALNIVVVGLEEDVKVRFGVARQLGATEVVNGCAEDVVKR